MAGAMPDLAGAELFVLKSSLNHEFLVVSEGQLVDSTPPTPTEEQIKQQREIARQCVAEWERCGAVVIADFEGEIPGHGGVIVTAAFRPTCAVDAGGQKARMGSAGGEPPCLGLLLDLRSSTGTDITKLIMESAAILKLIWGADADVKSLMFQAKPHPLGMVPRSVIDVQLGFSDPARRLGMKRMLEQVPGQLLRGLPDKEQIDFDRFHSKNRRAMALPLRSRDASYCMDDLHRISAILWSQTPSGGSYQGAKDTTERLLEQDQRDPLGLGSLRTEAGWFAKGRGIKKEVKAVELKRHIMTIRAAATPLSPQDERYVSDLEATLDKVLHTNRVTIPADLSFAE